jgi:hypothetical protein
MSLAKILYEFMGYKDLTHSEILVVLNYFDNSEIFGETMDKLLKSDEPLSKDMRRFMADVFTKRVTTKKMGRPPTTRRDKWIHGSVKTWVSSGMSLTSNKDGNGACATIAELMNLSEDVILKAYQNMEKCSSFSGKGHNDPLHYVRMTMYDDNGVIVYDYYGDNVTY